MVLVGPFRTTRACGMSIYLIQFFIAPALSNSCKARDTLRTGTLSFGLTYDAVVNTRAGTEGIRSQSHGNRELWCCNCDEWCVSMVVCIWHDRGDQQAQAQPSHNVEAIVAIKGEAYGAQGIVVAVSQIFCLLSFR